MTRPVKFDAHVKARKAFVEAWLADRTEKCGQHLLWTGAIHKSHGGPRASLFGEGCNVRRMVLSAIECRSVSASLEVAPTCGDPACLSCLKEFNRSERQLLGFAVGRFQLSPVTNMRRARAQQAKTTLTWDKVREVRALRAEGVELKEVAARSGLSYSRVKKIVYGYSWKEMVPGASVFSFASLGGLAA